MNNIIKIALVGVVATMFVSCEKDFELQRPNQSPWQSVSEFELAVQSSYLYITERPWANALGMMALSGFGESDIALYTGATGDSYCAEYANRTLNKLTLGAAKELEGAFMYLYAASTHTNAALDLIVEAEKKGEDPFVGMNDADRAKMKQYKGELLFQRALIYWYIARKWAPPYNSANKDGKYFVMYHSYVNKAETLKDGELASVEEVYQGIVSDLKEAIKVLPEDYPVEAGSERMRVNKYAAEALLARILFYMGADANKVEIKSLLDDVIDQTNLYNLSEDPYSAFSKVGNGYGKETIWQICYSTDSERFDRNPGIFSYYKYNSGAGSASGYIAFAMSFSTLIKLGWMQATAVPSATNPFPFVVTNEAKADKRFTQLYKPVTSYADVAVPLVFVHKYFRAADPAAKAERRANRPLIRLADLYLMRAEINWLLKDKKGAADDVNIVRQRAGLATIDKNVLTEEDIEKERIKEMAAENADRMNWLIGLGRDIPAGERVDGKSISTIAYPYSNYYYQVPIQEQQNNAAYSK